MIDLQMRLALATFLGEERYRKFLRLLNTTCMHRGRLLFWQEDAWKEFVAAHPQWEMNYESLREQLRVCWVHGCELFGTRKRVYGPGVHLNYTREYTEVWSRMFPNSHEDLPERVTAGGYPLPIELAEVWECPECCKARAKWERRASSAAM